MSAPLLEVKNLKKHFPVHSGVFRRPDSFVQAINGVDFILPEGTIVGLVGESGCGKSTLARTCIRLLEPTSGTILYRGEDITSTQKNLKRLRREAQMVFQNPLSSLNPRKKIGDSIGEGLAYHRVVTDKKELDQRVELALEQVGLGMGIADRYPHEFSGGQLQRICIARCIALEPKLIIFDEALSALDVSIQGQIVNLLIDLQKRLHLSYLFIAHDLSVVKHLCDEVIVMYLGHIVESAPVKQLFDDPSHPYTKALLSAIPKSHPRENPQRILLQGEAPSPLHPPSGCPFRTRCPYATYECSNTPPKRARSALHFYRCILP